MAVARVLSATDNPQTDAARASGVGQPKVSMALTVLTFAPELADVVLAGGSLDEAYTTARKRPEQAVT